MGYLVRGEPAPARAEGAIEPDLSLPRACVIGAGCCGITAAKALYEAGVPFDCFEAGPVVGGLWVFRNPNGRSGAYSTLEMNTSGPRMSYSDFPLGSDDYPMHEAVRDYFDRYVDHFGIRETITFNTEVVKVERTDDGTWEVTIRPTSEDPPRTPAGEASPRTPAGEAEEVAGIEPHIGETRRYAAVLVCNGHHWDPSWPEPAPAGEFGGVQMHSNDYREPADLAGKRVVVVGGGNSGMDIARDASRVADATYLSLRRGVHVLKKRLGRKRKPVDQMLAPPWLPWFWKQKGFEVMRMRSGDVSDYGLPKPDHKVGNAHPTLSDGIHERLAAGAVIPKPQITELRGDRVAFADGSEAEADVIVYATGYRVSFPFLDPELIAAPQNRLSLWRRTFHPEVDGIYFIGLAQPLGAIMPLAERQAKWIAQLLRGEYALPSAEQMEAEIADEREQHAKRFYASPRHTMEVDFDEWMYRSEREIEAGRERAAD